VAQVTAALDRDVGEAPVISREIADRLDGAGSPAVGMAVRRLAAAAADLGAATRTMQQDVDLAPADDDCDDDAEPPADVPDEPAEPDEADEPRRLLPTTRTAIQVAVAGTLSIVLGGLVAPGQWFWAVITAFVVFAGANSRGELLVRAWSRTLGTLGGVIAGVVVASLVTGHVALQGAVVLLCVFLAFYLLPISYGLMTFFVTTMLGVLYGLLGRFSVGFMEIRLLETVIGAVAGATAALLVLPTGTRGVVAERAEAFITPVARILRSAADDLRAGVDVRPLAAEARDVDTQMHALLTSARPLGSYRYGDARARYERWRLLVGSCAAATRRFASMITSAGATCDPDTRTRLAELAATIADLAEAVAARDGDATADLVDRACAQEGTLVDLVEAVEAGPTLLRQAVHQLGRLRRVLDDLSREFGPRRSDVAATS